MTARRRSEGSGRVASSRFDGQAYAIAYRTCGPRRNGQAPDGDGADESCRHYLGALERRDGFVAAWQRFFEDVDALLLPSAMTTAFAHCEPGAPLDVDGRPAGYGDHGLLLVPCNLAGPRP
jgi:Asp-tRNA(Asn)/Glu-tRNA(Gln) amidotransferase A subunit family amidase